LTELLKQPLCHPLSLHDKVISLVVANGRLLLDVEIPKIKSFQKEMLEFFERSHPEIVSEIEETKVLSDDLKAKIIKAAEEFKQKQV
jgi:F-type H+-transporting ATPase subunit alpha